MGVHLLLTNNPATGPEGTAGPGEGDALYLPKDTPLDGLVVYHRESPYLVTTLGHPDPWGMLEMFVLEQSLRRDWWTVREGDVVMDVGASYGSYTLSALAAGAALVVAWEPDKLSLYCLAAQLALNGPSFLARCRLVAALAGDGTEAAVAPYNETLHSCVTPGDAPSRRLVLPVDSLAAGLTRLDWFKLDVDGAELDVLKGAAGTLRRLHPTILVECHEAILPDAGGKVAALVKPWGYALADERRGESGTNEHWQLWRAG